MLKTLFKKAISGTRHTMRNLSNRLLLLTIAFVMLAEILILVPTVAKFRVDWLMDRLAAAQIAALALEVSPDQRLPAMLQKELLRKTKVHSIAVKRPQTRVMALQSEMPHAIDAEYQLSHGWSLRQIIDGLAIFFQPADRIIRVSGRPDLGSNDEMEIVIEEAPLKAALYGHIGRILLLSGFISLFTATLIYLSLDRLLVRPMTRLTSNIMHFAKNPEDRSRVIKPGDRNDVIGAAERELAQMQTQLGDTLHQKNRLAMLGLAVSKINHDLRNILASTQLISDRLASLSDPVAKTLTPKLLLSLDRAIGLCSDTLKYGHAQEPSPEREVFVLAPLIDEIGEGLGIAERDGVRLENAVTGGLSVDADRNQMYRVLANLIRNAAEAIEAVEAKRQKDGTHLQLPGLIRVTAERNDATVTIQVTDSGPGIPERARDHLFEPFQGSGRKGGTGLGLAITAELLHAHGGDIRLKSTGAHGTSFEITLPDQNTGAGARTDMQRSA